MTEGSDAESLTSSQEALHRLVRGHADSALVSELEGDLASDPLMVRPKKKDRAASKASSSDDDDPEAVDLQPSKVPTWPGEGSDSDSDGRAKQKRPVNKKAARRAARKQQEQQAAQGGEAEHVCRVCEMVFDSNTKLHSHVRSTGHALAVPTAAANANGKRRKGGKKKK